MPITRSPFSERELWDQAYALLDLHGENTGNIILAQLREHMGKHDQKASATWLSLADKVGVLGDGPETPAQLQ